MYLHYTFAKICRYMEKTNGLNLYSTGKNSGDVLLFYEKAENIFLKFYKVLYKE